MNELYVHSSADVDDAATVGLGAKIWHGAQVREGAVVGENCIVGKNVYVGAGVTIGPNCKVQNNAALYEGLTLEAGAFVGPSAVFTNDRNPRAINSDGSLKAPDDWDLGRTVVRYGATVGASSTVLPGLVIGRWALVGAGSVVTRDGRPDGSARVESYSVRLSTAKNAKRHMSSATPAFKVLIRVLISRW